MTIRQNLLKLIYPIWRKLSKFSNKRNASMLNEKNIASKRSIYELNFETNKGEHFKLDSLKGKSFLLVNTASNCGYTRQYEQLQEMHNQGHTIIGFPANDFGAQEPGSDEEIASFCQINYGVNFPLAKKSTVIKSANQHEIFKWLTSPDQNGWNDTEPNWNFCKYLIDEEGNLKGVFGSSVEPAELIEYL